MGNGNSRCATVPFSTKMVGCPSCSRSGPPISSHLPRVTLATRVTSSDFWPEKSRDIPSVEKCHRASALLGHGDPETTALVLNPRICYGTRPSPSDLLYYPHVVPWESG